MIKKKLFIFILFFNFFSFSYSEFFYIASFNTLRLGQNKKNYQELASAVSEFSLIGLVEVMTKKGVEEFVDVLENETNKKWDYFISPYPVGSSNYKEFFAYIWKRDEVIFLNELGFYPDLSSNFSRPPFGASFRIENFDFSLILVHSIYGKKKSYREAEAFYLSDVYTYFQNLDPVENDIIIAGDFNLPANHSAFTRLLTTAAHEIIFTVDPHLKTTLGTKKLANSYDNMFLSSIYTKEFTGSSGVYNFVEENFLYSRKFISDHLPVFIQVDGSTDDD